MLIKDIPIMENIDHKGKENCSPLVQKTVDMPDNTKVCTQVETPIPKKINWDKNIIDSLVSIRKRF